MKKTCLDCAHLKEQGESLYCSKPFPEGLLPIWAVVAIANTTREIQKNNPWVYCPAWKGYEY